MTSSLIETHYASRFVLAHSMNRRIFEYFPRKKKSLLHRQSDDLACVDEMVVLLKQGYDLVCGSRYMTGGRQIGGPRLKKIMSRIAGVSLHYLIGIPTHDVTNSFKMYSKKLLDDIRIERDGGFELGMEIAVKAHVKGYRITEVPTTWTDRTSGQSRFRLARWLPKYLHWYWFAIKNSF